MPRFAANLSLLFAERPFVERFAAAAQAGFAAVEFLFPYAFPPAVLAQARAAAGVEVVLFNLPPGDPWESGGRGLAAIPGREAEFRAQAALALDYARALGCPRLHALSGITAGLDRAACEAAFVANVRFAADLAAPHGITVLAEPLNRRDAPGYFLAHQQQAVDLLDRVDRTNVGLQLDLYHAQIMDGDLTRLIERLAGRIAHVQIASVPDRHEPDEGELNVGHLCATLDRVGYAGWIGCEYHPRGTTEEGLGWIDALSPARARR